MKWNQKLRIKAAINILENIDNELISWTQSCVWDIISKLRLDKEEYISVWDIALKIPDNILQVRREFMRRTTKLESKY